jgi:hypothetical protein
MNWKLIETAPKDGTWVMLFVAQDEAWCPIVARWNGDGWGDEASSSFFVEGLNWPTHWAEIPPGPNGETQPPIHLS